MNIPFKKAALLGGAILALGSCDDFLDVNQNPNDPTEVPSSFALPNAINRPAVVSGNTLNVLGNLWVGNWAQAGDYLFYLPEQQYNLTPLTYESVWTEMYAGSLPDLAYIERQARASGDKNTLAIARIMQAYDYQILVDAFGDVPFGESLQGTSNLTPNYEKAEVIYDNLITMLNEGLASIDVNATNPGTNDILFKGDMAKWRRFANTLKLRVYLRQAQARPTVAQQGIQAMATAGATFLGANENAAVNPGYLNTSGKQNPLYALFYNTAGAETSNRKATRANTLGLDYLKATNDTLRLKRIYSVVSGRNANSYRNYQGLYSGAPSSNPIYNSTRLSAPGASVVDAPTNNGFAKPVYLMLASESFFLQAEAAQRGWLTGASAQTQYENGIKESFRFLGFTDAQAQTYYAQTTAATTVADLTAPNGATFDPKAIAPNWTAAQDKIEAIITQKWIANNGFNGFEAWSEFRRTGFPKGNYISLNATQQQFPVRIPYPQNELSNNPNTPKGVTIFTPKIFWDVN
ncbi:SusD/RagB family nutrient-binding outer membrane lipoprotein [Hymenobacter jeollabukensis]|nr:SusD/RagB family nutrient-binding outer membrane lipoprotein [Hymenobacter jeollabukensis]